MAMMYRKQQSKYLTNYLSIFWEKLIFLKCILKSFSLSLCYDSWKSIVYFSFIISKYIIYQNIILFFLTQNSLFNYSITIESSNKLFNLVLFKHFCNTIFHSLTFRNSPFDAHLKCHLCINWNWIQLCRDIAGFQYLPERVCTRESKTL